MSAPSDASTPRTRTTPGRALTLTLVMLAAAVVAGVAAFAQVPTPTQRPSTLEARIWDFSTSPVGPMKAAVLMPARRDPSTRWPLLVAFHGWGESNRGVDAGAWGWARDYELGSSDAELRHTPLRREAFLGFVEPARYERLRRDLARRPYRGVIVVTPYTPDTLDGDAGTLAQAYADWIATTLVPRARRELPVLQDRGATGVDGVSLGGLTALEAGFSHPEVFGVVGALQPAVNRRVERVLSRRRSGAPPQRVRLVGSRADSLTRHVMALHDAMNGRRIPHDLRLVEGPHDYIFNRGPGGVEMLLFHDRALRGLTAE